MFGVINMGNIFGWFFGTFVFVTGTLNMLLVHMVPGMVYILISLIYFPPTGRWINQLLGFTFPVILKVFLAIIIFFFTLGVSDLGDIIDKL